MKTNPFLTRTTNAVRLLVLMLMLPATVQAQFTFITNNGAINITGYTGSGGAVTIPDTISGLPVTSIGPQTFYHCLNLINLTIPNSVTNIGDYAFQYCFGLTGVYFRGNAPNIGINLFFEDTNVTVYYIPVTTGWSATFEGAPNRTLECERPVNLHDQ